MSVLPAYSIVPRYNWEDLLLKLDTITGVKAAEFENAAGQTLYPEGWQRLLSDSLFRRKGRDIRNTTKLLVVFIPNSFWAKFFFRKRQAVVLKADHFIEEIHDIFEEDFDESNLHKYPDYHPDIYDAQGRHLCNIYGITLRSRFRIIIQDMHYDYDLMSNAELWTPYKFKLGKFDPMSPNVDFKKLFY
jgi:hypothetical protein